MIVRIVESSTDTLLNPHSNGYNGWSNPFGDFIPNVGDIIAFNTFVPFRASENKNFRTKSCDYVVTGRRFETTEGANNSYGIIECYLYVKKVVHRKKKGSD